MRESALLTVLGSRSYRSPEDSRLCQLNCDLPIPDLHLDAGSKNQMVNYCS